ncbi:uncharacterized protein LAESUDRAFT_750209 [Laetiporus sulphureus 93-53]|uniref:Uncharacterized protein n=1 Tax=Laetiporus sulphureus 93-53 TaxID=1314785 RepID=A0A165E201_9APHY|nr:uncharacterized protein LAESUDRAFT_750209 [Laetiporus sulphureus 93-53]KZT06093.1 hypothetical protein LAESUDRAFT_750209 [Laetiporus sulphureus 93-53]
MSSSCKSDNTKANTNSSISFTGNGPAAIIPGPPVPSCPLSNVCVTRNVELHPVTEKRASTENKRKSTEPMRDCDDLENSSECSKRVKLDVSVHEYPRDPLCSVMNKEAALSLTNNLHEPSVTGTPRDDPQVIAQGLPSTAGSGDAAVCVCGAPPKTVSADQAVGINSDLSETRSQARATARTGPNVAGVSARSALVKKLVTSVDRIDPRKESLWETAYRYRVKVLIRIYGDDIVNKVLEHEQERYSNMQQDQKAKIEECDYPLTVAMQSGSHKMDLESRSASSDSATPRAEPYMAPGPRPALSENSLAETNPARHTANAEGLLCDMTAESENLVSVRSTFDTVASKGTASIVASVSLVRLSEIPVRNIRDIRPLILRGTPARVSCKARGTLRRSSQ